MSHKAKLLDDIEQGVVDRDVSVPRHLRLGITIEGALLFLNCIGFLVDDEEWLKAKANIPEGAPEITMGSFAGPRPPYSFQYDTSYSRAQDVKWIDNVHGPIHNVNPENRNWGDVSQITGYDMLSVIRQWVKANSYSDLSICEIILKDARFEKLRHHVSTATLFYSHLQLKEPLDTFYCMGMAQRTQISKLPAKHKQFWWLDYFCLRQCVDDFKTDQMIVLVRDIGLTVAEIDDKPVLGLEPLEYLRRSFCILELYATIDGGAELVCHLELGHGNDIRGNLRERPVDSQRATTRNAKHKAQIDDFIADMDGGFGRMDSIVADAILSSAARAGSMCQHFCCGCCYRHFGWAEPLLRLIVWILMCFCRVICCQCR
jgi:hypothetical protein